MESMLATTDSKLSTARTNPPNGKPKKLLTRKKRRLLFYTLFWILPVIHFVVFYVIVNGSYFTMAFQKYSYATDGKVGYVIEFAKFDNFLKVIPLFFQAENGNNSMLVNSLIVYGLDFLCGTVVALTFAFYIYKKYIASEFFRIILFLPQVLSSVVLTMLFQNICSHVIEEQITFPMVLLYFIWTSFGVNIIMYTSAMSGINPSISESCQLDGAGPFQEFWHITVPMIFPTITTFIVLGITNLFTHQLGLYTFFRDSAEYKTVGYYMYIQTLKSDMVALQGVNREYLSYSEISAMGLTITAIVLPVTLFVRRMLKKFGPSVD
ncbi:MAG: sugar ABC transporter permease [Clostridiales bacterium]|nr:sugar ABC transporter permease [Clostridiales bacterium]